jgi:Spy/CpxP family protein refolding chaperone
MNKSKWIAAAAAFALSASLAVAAPGDGYGKHGKKHGKHGKSAFGSSFAQKLNLTDAQKAQLESLNRSFREQNKAVFEQNRETVRQYREARKANDTAKIESLRPAMDAQRAQMKQLRDAHSQQILSILTPEQRQQWDALKAERKSKGDKKQRL